MEQFLKADLLNAIKELGIEGSMAHIVRTVVIIFAIGLISVLANFITKKIITKYLRIFIKKTKNEIDDIYYEKNVFSLLSHIVPALIIYFFVPMAFSSGIHYPFEVNKAIAVVQDLTYIYIIIIILQFINSFLSATNLAYAKISEKKNIQLSIKGYIQVLKILFIIIGIILIASVILDKKPDTIFAGLGAMAAILLLIFKDTILGFVAGVQLSAYNMMKVGDWISMPTRNADGTVIDISLSTVKVQNFDKTITTIPTYALVTESFTNWEGMQNSGGRRIKRSIYIDLNTVKFVDEVLLEKFKKIDVLSQYISEKVKEINEYNSQKNRNNLEHINGRKLTNIGTFRKYIELYLQSKLALIDEKQTFINGKLTTVRTVLKEGKFLSNQTLVVRQLEPTEKGLPIEIYAFASTTAWAEFESIQSDLFDHILAVVPEFELRIFQNPSGQDFKRLNS
jgi:miniconductance mechanosensitive channel